MRIAKFYPLLVSAVILLSGCGGDQYSIEKRFYKTQKMAEKIFINPNASPPKQVENVVNALEGFIKKYPKINLSVQAEFTIARLYIVKEEFDKAIQRLREVIAKYKKLINMQNQKNIASSLK